MEWQEYKQKKVFVKIDTSVGERTYSGIINDVVFMGKNLEGVEIFFLELIDKYGMKIGFNSNCIKFIQEER